MQYLYNNFDVNRLYAEVFANNPGSAKVLEKNGFKLEACLKENVYKNGVFVDNLIYAYLRSDWQGSQ
jgi:[ribosomal protein S5]-alanine N-acetyltransferase